jgi:ABC-type spermidine/putrescine transport system permease subunit I
MPFIGLIGATLAVLVTFLIIILKFPKSWQVKESFKERKMFFVVVISFTQIILFTYLFLEWAFAWIDPSNQWMFAILLPFIREGLTHIFAWLCSKSSGINVFTINY